MLELRFAWSGLLEYGKPRPIALTECVPDTDDFRGQDLYERFGGGLKGGGYGDTPVALHIYEIP